MKTVCYARYGPLGASSRLRLYQYIPHFKRVGLNPEVFPLLDDRYVAQLYRGSKSTWLGARGYARRILQGWSQHGDRIFLEKELFPWLPLALDASYLKDVPYVLDLDDAIFHYYDRHSSSIIRRVLGKKIDRLMADAAVVSAGNEYLAERATSAGARQVAVVPTSIDVSRYRVEPQTEKRRVTIGWIGTPVTQHYLKPLARVLRDLAQDSRFRVVLVGADQEPRKWFPCQVRQWKEGLEVDDILDFDIGIMPLSDTPWERGKCGYKLIQYMACGKPVVASPVGFNKTVVKHKHNGYWAITEEDWTSYLTLLSADFAARIEMGRLGREAVEKNFSTQVTGPRLSRMIMNLRAA